MIRNNLKWIVGILLLAFIGTSLLPLVCSNDPKATPSVVEVEKSLADIKIAIPKFDSDSAYASTEKIVSFGPRVTGSTGSLKVRGWIVNQLKKYGADVIEQPFKAKTFDGKTLDATNIIARFNPSATKRIMLSAHWDSRPFADQDSSKKKEPILGADDSGSAIAMLIEVARQLHQTPLSNLGVDIILFDAEDYGDGSGKENTETTWCLGSQHWAKNPHAVGYTAKYGINLDMAGARGARFTKELFSMKFASTVVEKVWRVGRYLGYTHLFVDESSRGPMIDDHYFVNTIARIPTIDIINHPTDSYFGKYWHTHDDNMTVIDKETLRGTGQTVLSVLHYENAGAFAY
ncbi:MAG: M28 family peptidase [Saprospiraceae bacterium]|nr:M28 family peptidase [Saprospiraceae bacterium]